MGAPRGLETPWSLWRRTSVAVYFASQVAMQLYVATTNGGSALEAISWALAFAVIALLASFGRFVLMYLVSTVLLGMLGVGTVVFAIQLTDVPRIYEPQYSIPRGILNVVALCLCLVMVAGFRKYRRGLRPEASQSAPLPPPSQFI